MQIFKFGSNPIIDEANPARPIQTNLFLLEQISSSLVRDSPMNIKEKGGDLHV